MKYLLLTIAAVSIIFSLSKFSNASPVVWNGAKITFTKNDSADWTLAENQDRITGLVWITRKNKEGIFNIKTETGYADKFSPTDTEWATGSAVDFASLTFRTWEEWHGGNPRSMLGVDAVVHLISDDIYIDIKFLSWSKGGQGGGFSYERSSSVETRVKPVANAGADQIVYDEIKLDGSLSTDPGGEIVSYHWQIKHRVNSNFDKTATGQRPTVANLERGFYDVILAVEDNDGEVDTDDMFFSATGLKGDFDFDGKVDGADLAKFAEKFGLK